MPTTNYEKIGMKQFGKGLFSSKGKKSVQFDISINLHWELHYERVPKPSHGQVLRSELASEDMIFFS